MIYSEDIIRYYNSYEDIVKSNFALTIEMLIADITNGIKSDLEKLNNSNNKYSLNLNSLSYDKSKIENIDNESTKYMRNKEKKRFKKERTLVQSEGISSKVSNLNSEISSLNQRKAFIKEQIISKESELIQFTQNSKEYTISDLINLQKKYVNINNDNNKYKKNRKLNNSQGVFGVRQYHSLSHRNFSTNISKINFNVTSPIFLELQRFLNNSPLNSNTQMKIEEFLNDQGRIVLNNRISQPGDINYYKLNPYVFDCLLKPLNELELLINNYRNNLNN